jgi:uncharacterized protein
MTESNVEVVERFFATPPDDMATVLHPEVRFHEAVGLPYSGDWVGLDGVRDLLSEVLGNLKMELHARELIDIGSGRVLALMSVRFTSRNGGASIDTTVVEVYTVKERQVVGADIYYKDPAGVAALFDEAAVTKS